jgi:hypothetical protein
MSSILWQHHKTYEYSYSTKPCLGDLAKLQMTLVRLGSFQSIKEKIQSYMFSQTFSKSQILREPAKYAAYFVFMQREAKVEMSSECNLLAELLESVDPYIWVQNRDIVSLLLGGLIEYSKRL